MSMFSYLYRKRYFLCLLISFLLIKTTLTVDRSNFRACKDSSFCTRQRNHWPAAPEYILNKENIISLDYGIFAVLISTVSGKKLNLSVTLHELSAFRILIDENEPIRPRYRTAIGDALVEDPKPILIKTTFLEKKIVVSGKSDEKLEIYFNPFSLIFSKKGENLISINERGLLNFEHQLEKPEEELPISTSSSEPESADLKDVHSPSTNDEISYKAEDENYLVNNSESNVNATDEPEQITQHVKKDWSEQFKDHTDSRPYGPTSIAVDITYHGFNYVYGIPEHADSFALKNTDGTDPYRLYNLDVFEYELNNPMALYGSVPVMWAHRKNATAGIFWNNPSETWIDVKLIENSKPDGIISKFPNIFSNSETQPMVKTRWMSEAGVIDIFVMLANNPSAALKSYSLLTGTTKLPPLFSLAHHQSRWNYKNEEEVTFIAKKYDENNIPVDAIWLDIEYSDNKRYFKWNTVNFNDPNAMVKELSSTTRKLVVVFDPHIKMDNNWNVFREGESNDYYVKKANGQSFDGWCWPGSSLWPDFLRTDVSKWWSSLFLDEEFLQSDAKFYVWNDMNEPSVFSGPEITLPKDAKHGIWENREIHNIYGLRVHASSWNGLLLRHKTERPFVLTRAFFAGSQRTSTVWTGDNKASWDHLQITTPMLLSLSMTGITFCGADVGGFFGHPSNTLYVRWYQAAVFHPFIRSHAHIDTPHREPWTLPKEYMDLIRTTLQVRYSLLPYWYTLFARGEHNGQPPMAPLLLHFPTDASTFAIDNQFMVGEALLVHPVVHDGATTVEPYLPNGTWYLRSNWRVFKGGKSIILGVSLSSIPFFYRGGFIVPIKARPRRSSAAMVHDPYTIVVCLDPTMNRSTGYIYFDDFHSLDKTSARYFQLNYILKHPPSVDLSFDPSGTLSMTKLPLPGSKTISNDPSNTTVFIPSIERMVFVGFNTKPSHVSITMKTSGERIPLTYSFVEPESESSVDGSRAGILVIRKPNVLCADDWKLKISTSVEILDEL